MLAGPNPITCQPAYIQRATPLVTPAKKTAESGLILLESMPTFDAARAEQQETSFSTQSRLALSDRREVSERSLPDPGFGFLPKVGYPAAIAVASCRFLRNCRFGMITRYELLDLDTGDLHPTSSRPRPA
jgi:hypothetical protein